MEFGEPGPLVVGDRASMILLLVLFSDASLPTIEATSDRGPFIEPAGVGITRADLLFSGKFIRGK